MTYESIAEFLEEKYENYFQGLYNQVPNVELKKYLVRVSNDRELSYMFDVEEIFGRLKLYLNHLYMDLSMDLSQANTTEMDARVTKTICLPKKRYWNDFSMDYMIDWTEMKVEQSEEKYENYFQGLYNQVPNVELKKYLVRVSNDRELSYMFDVEEIFGRLKLYLNHLYMDLSMDLSQANTTEMDARVTKTICLPKKRYWNDFSMDYMIDWTEMKVEQSGRSSL
nr:peroxidase 20 [Tanacetum cinerariifolium]